MTEAENISANSMARFVRAVLKELNQICVNGLQPIPGTTPHPRPLSAQGKVSVSSRTVASDSEAGGKNAATFSSFSGHENGREGQRFCSVG